MVQGAGNLLGYVATGAQSAAQLNHAAALKLGLSKTLGDELSVTPTVWLSPITTDANGKATTDIQLPDSAGQWSLRAKGCTTETLVGQAEAKIITRKDFLIELRISDTLQEGDAMSFIATVHNLTDFEGRAKVDLKISGGAQPFTVSNGIDIKPDSSTEIVLGPYTIPFAEALSYEVSAAAGPHRDTTTGTANVRPWGIEFADHAGGLTSTEAGFPLALPEGKNYTGRKLHISLSPSME